MGTESPRQIGLALSGGGSRAMAFHLGCLRALKKLGLLDQVSVISTVSGGSVIGAYYHLHRTDFAEFEKGIERVLLSGLAQGMVERLFGKLGLKVLAAFLLTLIVAFPMAVLRVIRNAVAVVSPAPLARALKKMPLNSPVHRFASRTTLLEATLDDLLFSNAKLDKLTEQPRLVINATELRTGSSFRFGNIESGSWRWGRLCENSVRLAHAVAASAAYPLFLPAFDQSYFFEKSGKKEWCRVLLTDGGVYDNLGLGCLWPGRSFEVSLNVCPVDTIISCSAGYGLRQDPPSQFVFARMISAFNTTFERAQNASINRLHEIKQFGRIKDFIFPYLGQLDHQLPRPPHDLVRREEAHTYPTNFSAMTKEWIDRLSLRGEQLTLCLAREHIPHLINERPTV